MNQLANIISQLYHQYLPAQYIWRPRPDLPPHQRFQMNQKLKKRCFKCGKRIVAQGRGRANGANRIQWQNRRVHVKCYKKAKKGHIYQFFEDDNNHLQEEDGNQYQDTLSTTFEFLARIAL